MAVSTRLKELANAALRPIGLKVESLTRDRAEARRLAGFEQRTGFDAPIYPLSPGMAEFDAAPLAEGCARHREALAALKDPARNRTGYRPGNGYFETPDADMLYLMVRRFAPGRVIEVGCGSSTRVTRQAVIDGGLSTRIVAIDPQPRLDIAGLVDGFYQSRVEELEPGVFAELGPGDILFIDSSHEVRAGSDVAFLFCRVLPMLAPGVIVHVHDIFLPYEYARPFFFGQPTWGEQYLLHALLVGGGYEILWSGHYLQRTRPGLVAELPFLAEGAAQSFWMRKL
ncbi:MAG TPA: class I SAM-dependent methyltransferase [Paracoccaceae bacterium]|nr:class I SAM-dependent methyltransferase [Paracoccaceae bacterium]